MRTYLFPSTQVYAIIEPPPILTIKKEVEIKNKNIIKIKLRLNPNSSTSEKYEFKVGTFNSSPQEEILQLLTKFDKEVVGTGISSNVGKIAFLRTLLRGKALRE